MKVLVTGYLGYCGQAIVAVLLEHGHQVIGFDRQLPEYAVPENLLPVIGDINKISTLLSAIDGCQAVIHAAIGSRVSAEDLETYRLKIPAETDLNLDRLIPYYINVNGSFHIFELAHQFGVHQVVNLSSAAVVYHHIIDRENDEVHQVHLDAGTSPNFRGFYGLNKYLQEQIGEFYARNYGMSVVTLRPWWVVDGPTFRNRMGHDLRQDTHPLSPAGLVCRYDLGQAVLRALERPDICYDIFYPTSSPYSELFFDLEHIRRELGWHPRYTFEELVGLPIRKGIGG